MGALDGKVAIVTGANSGIGLPTAIGLARQGAHVVLACRDPARGQEALASLQQSVPAAKAEFLALDLASTSAIRSFVAQFTQRHPALHILVNNAGVWPMSPQKTADGFEMCFGTNHVGTFLLTHLLLDALKKAAPARVVNLSSKLHFSGDMVWDDLMFEHRKFEGQAAYRQSKLANVLFTKALARRVHKDNITVNAVHPGVVATKLAREFPALAVKIFHLFLISPEKGALTSIHVATSEEGGMVTGKYFEKSRQKPALAMAEDEANQDRLWALTEKMLGISAG